VSDNRSVQVTGTKERGVWPWIAGLISVAAALFAARKWFARFSWLKKLLGF
jgi:hypothetical protein